MNAGQDIRITGAPVDLHIMPVIRVSKATEVVICGVGNGIAGDPKLRLPNHPSALVIAAMTISALCSATAAGIRRHVADLYNLGEREIWQRIPRGST
jgi:hypothetical protein